MRAGRLNRRVQYQTLSEGADSLGQEEPTFTTQGTYWALIRNPGSTEALNASQMKCEASHILVMRYSGFVPSPTGRFLYGSRVFNVTGVLNIDERNREIRVMCIEVVAGATS